MTLKRIPIDDHPGLVSMLDSTYEGIRVDSIYVHEIVIDGKDVNIKADITFDGAWMIKGTIQMELDDGDSFTEKLQEIIQLEDGND